MSHLCAFIFARGTAQHLKGIRKKRLCGGFHLVISLSDAPILASPHPERGRINNGAKEESVSWTCLLSAAWEIRHVCQPIIRLPLQIPVQKANKTQLSKPKEIERIGLGWSQLRPPAAASNQLFLQVLQSHHS